MTNGSSFPVFPDRLPRMRCAMPAIVVASLFLLTLIAGIVGVVVVGLEGRGASRLRRVGPWFAKLARHLNGDGTPPPAFLRVLRRLHVIPS